MGRDKRSTRGALVGLLGALLIGCAAPSSAAGPPSSAAGPPTNAGATPQPSRVGYERLQQAYSTWQLLDRAREATTNLQSWREADPDTGSSWQFAAPNRTHYRTVSENGEVHE